MVVYESSMTFKNRSVDSRSNEHASNEIRSLTDSFESPCILFLIFLFTKTAYNELLE